MPYDASGRYYAATTSDQPASTGFDSEVGQYIPLDLLGSRGRMQAQRDAQTANANRGYWNSLDTPSAGQLSSQQGQDAESQALQQMQQWSSGQLTGADRGSLEATRGRDAQAAGASQRALMQGAQARGVGGSGIDLATRQQASQLGQQQSSDAESQALAMAQQRGLAATQASAGIGSRMRDEAAHGATQQAFEDQASRAAGATGQYGTDAQSRQQGRDRQHENDTSLVGLLASL